ncbi:cell division protein ZapA [Blastochloris tepida]|jgi:cell division protein ZapA|uniref:Cell division protein ZapA n=1 Tax=Blastochloris tepida TaxID=2233851 RepID=A0A348G5H7_9HYPH|nr:cell division protein ZapA [Blastochloris tepida]BBF94810.1 cell division protein ZapA [Blastochloris tepida]
MGQVNVTINGRQYRMACEDGQENHLVGLAEDLEKRINGLRAAFGEIGDQRLTMMAAIMVADELHEAGRRIQALEAERDALTAARAQAAAQVEANERAAAAALETAAQRIERLAQGIATAPREGPAMG